MASNTKLSKAEKATLKDFKANMPKNMAFGFCVETTVLVEVNKNVVRFSTSVAGPDEVKIRRKVGQYHAMLRWGNGETAIMPSWAFAGMSAEDVANRIADILNKA